MLTLARAVSARAAAAIYQMADTMTNPLTAAMTLDRFTIGHAWKYASRATSATLP